jgi:hypothetical protein
MTPFGKIGDNSARQWTIRLALFLPTLLADDQDAPRLRPRSPVTTSGTAIAFV